ncbi:Hypothetical predicted protein [Octopus vulgaris]|uniref:Tctex1 domain-containing protein 2 n=1 Tax=Octopus vulgaris TaxID=6645 RepID=A0AA36BKT4_OCTVU|nr:Hypothetical predicted protein [Octopus vulgaris]
MDTRFQPLIVKECIRSVLMDNLAHKEYSSETMAEDTKVLVELIRKKIKDLAYDRYKIIVQVHIGEYRGQGIKIASRKFWDADTDNFAQWFVVFIITDGTTTLLVIHIGMEYLPFSCLFLTRLSLTPLPFPSPSHQCLTKIVHDDDHDNIKGSDCTKSIGQLGKHERLWSSLR